MFYEHLLDVKYCYSYSFELPALCARGAQPSSGFDLLTVADPSRNLFKVALAVNSKNSTDEQGLASLELVVVLDWYSEELSEFVSSASTNVKSSRIFNEGTYFFIAIR